LLSALRPSIDPDKIHFTDASREVFLAITNRHARISKAGIWTCGGNLFSVLVHLIGVGGLIPSLFVVLRTMLEVNENFKNTRGGGNVVTINVWNLTVWLPMNLWVGFLCGGIPHLRVLGWLNFIVGGGVAWAFGMNEN